MKAVSPEPLLEVRAMGKSFPGVRALNDVSLKLETGEVLAVLGENGAGKSTLMKILAGVQPSDEGQILMAGKPVEIAGCERCAGAGDRPHSPGTQHGDQSQRRSQYFSWPEPRKRGLIDEAAILEKSKNYLEMVGLEVDPQEILGTLAIGRQQLVEIAKALSVKARVLIMDEPTSSLSQRETDTLFGVIRDLRGRGVSIIYISHRLGEAKELADRVMVLRDGENAGDLAKDEINHDAMVRLMVGREISEFYSRTIHEPGEVALEVRRLRTSAHPEHELNFSLRAGEVVGMAGLVGAGRTELLAALFGVAPLRGGGISLCGAKADLQSPEDAIRGGLALVPEDRKLQGLILEMTVRQNLGLAILKQESSYGLFLNEEREGEISRKMMAQMQIKTPSSRQVVRYLSGGNQQKVVLGKWLALEPRVLLLDEPTRGIDVGAKQEIYGLMEDLAACGVAILFVSSEMEEVLRMSDRVLVMHEGRLTGELPRDRLSEEAVMQLAIGNTKAA